MTDGPNFLEPNDLSPKLQAVFARRYHQAALELQAWGERHGISIGVRMKAPRHPSIVLQFGGAHMAGTMERILEQGTYVVSQDDPPLEITGDL